VGLKYTKEEKEMTVDVKQSEMIWDHMKKSKWIADDGLILDAFSKAVDEHTFSVPESVKDVTREIIETIEQHRIEQHVTRGKNRDSDHYY